MTILRMTWPELRVSKRFRGQWLAIDHFGYDPATQCPSSGTIVDSDRDLAALCLRMRRAGRRACRIVLCSDTDEVEPLAHSA